MFLHRRDEPRAAQRGIVEVRNRALGFLAARQARRQVELAEDAFIRSSRECPTGSRRPGFYAAFLQQPAWR